MKSAIESLSHRSLRRLANFKKAFDGTKFDLEEGEDVIGIYYNSDSDFVAITTIGIRPSGTSLIRYDEMIKVWTEDDKHEASTISLRLTDGRTASIRISGGHQRFRDVWEVIRFLDRAMESSTREKINVRLG